MSFRLDFAAMKDYRSNFFIATKSGRTTMKKISEIPLDSYNSLNPRLHQSFVPTLLHQFRPRSMSMRKETSLMVTSPLPFTSM